MHTHESLNSHSGPRREAPQCPSFTEEQLEAQEDLTQMAQLNCALTVIRSRPGWGELSVCAFSRWLQLSCGGVPGIPQPQVLWEALKGLGKGYRFTCLRGPSLPPCWGLCWQDAHPSVKCFPREAREDRGSPTQTPVLVHIREEDFPLGSLPGPPIEVRLGSPSSWNRKPDIILELGEGRVSRFIWQAGDKSWLG